MPSNLCEDPEPEVSIETVRRAQGLVGELLWLASRTRPDISYGVAIMGRLVTKCPARVLEWGQHMLGYVQATADHELFYSASPPAAEQITEEPCSGPRLHVLSDASHGPNGGCGHQGLIVLYNQAPAQWESKQQPFATLFAALNLSWSPMSMVWSWGSRSP